MYPPTLALPSRAKALEAAEGKNVGVFGANVARQCIDGGVLDEIVVHPARVLLGDGVRFYDNPGRELVDLRTISGAQSMGR